MNIKNHYYETKTSLGCRYINITANNCFLEYSCNDCNERLSFTASILLSAIDCKHGHSCD